MAISGIGNNSNVLPPNHSRSEIAEIAKKLDMSVREFLQLSDDEKREKIDAYNKANPEDQIRFNEEDTLEQVLDNTSNAPVDRIGPNPDTPDVNSDAPGAMVSSGVLDFFEKF